MEEKVILVNLGRNPRTVRVISLSKLEIHSLIKKGLIKHRSDLLKEYNLVKCLQKIYFTRIYVVFALSNPLPAVHGWRVGEHAI